MPTLTSTSYAILGLLSLKPWTTYELAKQMDRGMRRFWPRAESRIYDEPAKLTAAGFARAKKETVGKRPRTTYSITASGRRALARWLDEEGDPPHLEFEGLLKVFFGEQGSRDAILAHLRAAQRWAEEQLAQDAEVVQGYLDEAVPFPERLPVIVITGKFLSDFARLVGEWALWAEAEVTTWPEELSRAPVNRAVMSDVVGRRPLRQRGSRQVGG